MAANCCPAAKVLGDALGRRISVVGCSGSGKTTLARHLARELGCPHIELDALYHQANWQPLQEDEFLKQVSKMLQPEHWVVEGNYSAVRQQILQHSDMVIWLDFPRATVMRQVILRTLKRLLTRAELWNGNRERWANLFRLDPRRSILAWTWTRHPVYRSRYSAEMKAAPPSQRYIRLGSHAETEQFLNSLSVQVPVRRT
ncbi:AAA family ATPase [Ectopseudomonas mendocina]|uniref:AAA family ATPase n=1 Tax=Ectopseudomonas mendocina TaxID=300 RepID=A0ABZ2RHP1_ECTME